MTYTEGNRTVVPPLVGTATTGWSSEYHQMSTTGSGTWNTANRTMFYPIRVPTTCVARRFWWTNGNTVDQTYFWDVGIYRDNGFKPGALIRNTGPRPTTGSANTVEYLTPSISTRLLTNSLSGTDQDTYSTASVTLRAGFLYILFFANVHATAAPVASTVQTNGGAVSFTSRASVAYEGGIRRLSSWTAAPTSDVTAAIDISFGASSGVTGCIWGLLECANVDTATNHGIVQSGTAINSSDSPSVTLSSFGSTRNHAISAVANNGNVITPAAYYYEFLDSSGIDPGNLAILEYAQADEAPAPGTLADIADWGMVALEVKAGVSTTTLTPGLYWLAIACDNGSATHHRSSVSGSGTVDAAFRFQQDASFPMPLTVSSMTEADGGSIALFGFATYDSP